MARSAALALLLCALGGCGGFSAAARIKQAVVPQEDSEGEASAQPEQAHAERVERTSRTSEESEGELVPQPGAHPVEDTETARSRTPGLEETEDTQAAEDTETPRPRARSLWEFFEDGDGFVHVEGAPLPPRQALTEDPCPRYIAEKTTEAKHRIMSFLGDCGVSEDDLVPRPGGAAGELEPTPAGREAICQTACLENDVLNSASPSFAELKELCGSSSELAMAAPSFAVHDALSAAWQSCPRTEQKEDLSEMDVGHTGPEAPVRAGRPSPVLDEGDSKARQFPMTDDDFAVHGGTQFLDFPDDAVHGGTHFQHEKPQALSRTPPNSPSLDQKHHTRLVDMEGQVADSPLPSSIDGSVSMGGFSKTSSNDDNASVTSAKTGPDYNASVSSPKTGPESHVLEIDSGEDSPPRKEKGFRCSDCLGCVGNCSWPAAGFRRFLHRCCGPFEKYRVH